jgi:hypothetical protein
MEKLVTVQLEKQFIDVDASRKFARPRGERGEIVIEFMAGEDIEQASAG